jgi:hypothetical protein
VWTLVSVRREELGREGRRRRRCGSAINHLRSEESPIVLARMMQKFLLRLYLIAEGNGPWHVRVWQQCRPAALRAPVSLHEPQRTHHRREHAPNLGRGLWLGLRLRVRRHRPTS